MNKFLFFLLFLLITSFSGIAKIDSTAIAKILSNAQKHIYSNPDSCLSLTQKALQYIEKDDHDNLKPWAYNITGSTYWVKGNYVYSLKYFQKIVDFANDHNMPDLAAAGNGNIAVIYIDLGDLDLAYNYTHQSLASYKKTNDTNGVAVAVNNLGIIFEKKKIYDSALYYFETAAQYWGYNNDKNWLTLVESNRSNIYAAKGDVNNTLRHALKATEYAKDIDNEKSKGHAYISLARAMRMKKHYKEAEFYARKALALAKPNSIIEIIRDAHEQLYQAYIDQPQQLKSALYHYEQFNVIKDSMLDASKLNLVNHLKNKVKLEQKDKAIAQRDKQLLASEQARQRNLLYYSIIAGSLLFIMSMLFGLYRRQKLRVKAKTQQLLVEQQAHELAELNLKNEQLFNKDLSTQLDFKKQELLTYALSMTHKNQILQELQEQINTLHKNGQEKEVRQIKNNINAAMGSQENWEEFKLRFEQVHHTFFDTLKALYPKLSANDLRMCAFIKLDLSSKQIASLLNIAPSSVDMGKYRLKKKFGLEQEESLSELINTINKS
ncbi:MAG: hypothetical protein R2800_12610 [Flavipsychrobacter sp.]